MPRLNTWKVIRVSFDIGKTIACDHIDNLGYYWGDPDEVEGCPKCRGTKEYYDLAWNIGLGEPYYVEDLTLLQELTLKAVLTQIGDNKFHPNYGTSIMGSIANLRTVESVARTLETEIAKALAALYLRQQQQIQLGQDMSDDELINRIDKVETVVSDPRTLNVEVIVVAESGNDTTIRF